MPTWSMAVNRCSGRSRGAVMADIVAGARGARRDPRHPGRRPRGGGGIVTEQCTSDDPSLEAAPMSTFRHRRRGPYPDRSPPGRPQGPVRRRPRRGRHQGCPRQGGRPGEQVEYVIMGHVIQAGAGQITARQAAVKARHPDGRPVDHDQQGLPVGHQRDRAGRPADPRRRARDRRRRRHGVDDPAPRTCCRSRAPASSTATSTLVDTWPTTPCTTSSPTRRWATSPRAATPPAPT